jgi:hypothetical protein
MTSLEQPRLDTRPVAIASVPKGFPQRLTGLKLWDRTYLSDNPDTYITHLTDDESIQIERALHHFQGMLPKTLQLREPQLNLDRSRSIPRSDFEGDISTSECPVSKARQNQRRSVRWPWLPDAPRHSVRQVHRRGELVAFRRSHQPCGSCTQPFDW